jgi:hypothetical protein
MLDMSRFLAANGDATICRRRISLELGKLEWIGNKPLKNNTLKITAEA